MIMRDVMRGVLLGALGWLAVASWAQPDWNGQTRVKWSTVAQGTNSSLTKAENFTIETAGDWQRIYQLLFPGRNGASAPSIDFAKERLIVVALGKRSGTAAVYIETIDFDSGILRVRYVDQIPAKQPRRGRDRDSDKDKVDRTTSSPFVVVRQERVSESRIRFEGRTGVLYPTVLSQPSYGYGYGYPCEVPYATFGMGDSCGILSPGTTIIISQPSWESYYRLLTGNTDLTLMPKNIDWSTEYLIAINLGMRTSEGYAARIQSITASQAGSVELVYYEVSPKNLATAAKKSTSPYVIVRVPKAAGIATIRKLPGAPLGS